jgi:hypothetical protein
MMKLEPDQVTKILTTELGYQPAQAVAFVRDFPAIHDELADTVNRWLQDRTVIDTSIYGVTISEVMRVRRSNFLLALRAVNRLLDQDVDDDRRNQMIQDLRMPIARW